MNTKFFGEKNKNKFLKELIKVLKRDFADKEDLDKVVESIGQPNGIASLDDSGLIPSSQLPSYVDDIIEVEDYAHLPEEGETGKIYITLDTGNQYRWGGTEYVPLNENNIEGIGIKKIIKLTQSEYDALQEKEDDTIYITSGPKSIPNGVYIVYTDGSYSNYDTLDAGKTPLGVGLVTDNVAFVINPNQIDYSIWARNSNDFIEIDEVTNAINKDSALLDYAGKNNTNAAIISGFLDFNSSVFVKATSFGDNWYLPSCGEMEQIRLNVNNINIALSLINGIALDFSLTNYWSSTQNNNDRAWKWDKDAGDHWQNVQRTNDAAIRAATVLNPPLVYKIYQGTNLIASSDNSVEELQESVSNLQSTKVDKVATPTAGHLVKVDALGGLLDAGLAMVKMTKTEYDALVTKDPSTVYIVSNNGVYILYTDGSLTPYNAPLTQKTPVGPVIIDKDFSVILYPNHFNNRKYATSNVLITGVPCIADTDLAAEDFSGDSNQQAALLSADIGSAFTDAAATVFANGKIGRLPSGGEMYRMSLLKDKIDIALSSITGSDPLQSYIYWTSTQRDASWAYYRSGNISKYKLMFYNKTDDHPIRVVTTFEEKSCSRIYLGDILIADSNTINDIASILATI